MTADLWQQLLRSARVLAYSAPDGSGYGEMSVDPDAVYTVLPPGAVMRMPRDAEYWMEPHSHRRGGCEVVVWRPLLCPICRARAAGLL